MNQWPMVMIPLELIQRLIDLGTQDIYTDAREYRERTEDMHEAISELRAITQKHTAAATLKPSVDFICMCGDHAELTPTEAARLGWRRYDPSRIGYEEGEYDRCPVCVEALAQS